MRKILLAITISVAALFAGCISQDDISFGGITDVQVHGLSGLDVKFDVGNKSSRQLSAYDVRYEIKYGDRTVIDIVVPEKIVVPARFSGEITVPVKLKINDPFFLLSLGSNPERIVELTVTGSTTVRAGSYKKNIKSNGTPLLQILRKFGITETELEKYIPL